MGFGVRVRVKVRVRVTQIEKNDQSRKKGEKESKNAKILEKILEIQEKVQNLARRRSQQNEIRHHFLLVLCAEHHGAFNEESNETIRECLGATVSHMASESDETTFFSRCRIFLITGALWRVQQHLGRC